MTKNSTILTVSITMEQLKFLEDTETSPSELIQEKILERMEIWNKQRKEIYKIQENLENLQNEFKVAFKFLEETGNFDKYRKWRGEYVVQSER